MLTRNKKNYAGIVNMQEGRKVKPAEGGKLDLKGLAIRKVNTNRNARVLFEEILQEDILKAKDIDIPNIIKKYKDFEKEIYDSIKSGSTEYGTPGKANSASSYVEPFRQAPFRGAMVWNNLFPDQELALPARVTTIKLKLAPPVGFAEDISADRQLIIDMIGEEYSEYAEVLESMLADEDYQVGGVINTISIPEGVKTIPEFLIPFIDIDTMVNTTIKPGIILLESLGVQPIIANGSQYPSNIIKL